MLYPWVNEDGYTPAAEYEIASIKVTAYAQA